MKGKLTQRFVDTVAEAGRYADKSGTGLLLVVRPTGGRSWIQRTVVRGRQVDIGLGSCRRVKLAEARLRAFEYWCVARDGGDPREQRAAPDVVTFADGLEAVIAIQRPTWRNAGKSEGQWRASLRDHAGALMSKPVGSIGPGAVLGVLTPIWSKKRETAKRVKQRISAIMKWGIAEGLRTDNPVDAIDAALPKKGETRVHHEAVPYDRVGDTIRAVRATGAWWATKAALELLVLTAARSGEVRKATWDELDIDAATWTIPAGRMKMDRPHRVPLSPRALEVLEEAAQHRDASGLVFPSKTGRTMSDVVLSQTLKRLGVGGTIHGMRSSFRDWASEKTSTPHAVMEAALSHKVKNPAEAAYARSDLLERRRTLMDSWARYVTAEFADKVVAIR